MKTNELARNFDSLYFTNIAWSENSKTAAVEKVVMQDLVGEILVFFPRILQQLGMRPEDLGISSEEFRNTYLKQAMDRIRNGRVELLSPDVRLVQKVDFNTEGFRSVFGRVGNYFRHNFSDKLKTQDVKIAGTTLEIDEDFVHKTLDGFQGRTEKLNELKKCVEVMMFFSNHDVTMHSVGLLPGDKFFGELSQNFELERYDQSDIPKGLHVSGVEMVSIVFHRILLERIFSHKGGEKLQKIYFRIIDRFLKLVATLPEEVRSEWINLIGYLAFFVIDPKSDEGKKILDLGAVATNLSHVAHQKNFKGRKKMEGHVVSIEKLFSDYYLDRFQFKSDKK